MSLLKAATARTTAIFASAASVVALTAGCATNSPQYASMSPSDLDKTLAAERDYSDKMFNHYKATGTIPVDRNACATARNGSSGGSLAGAGAGAVVGGVASSGNKNQGLIMLGGALAGALLGKQLDVNPARQAHLDCGVLERIARDNGGRVQGAHIPVIPGGVNTPANTQRWPFLGR